MSQQNKNSDFLGLTILGLIVFLLAAIIVTYLVKVNSISLSSIGFERRSFQESGDILIDVSEMAQLGNAIPEAKASEPEEVVIEPEEIKPEIRVISPGPNENFKYIEVVDGCGAHFEGGCLNVRSGPGTEYPAIYQLRSGIVLKVDEIVEVDGDRWYKIIFDEWLRYPERLKGDWYIFADYVRELYDEGEMNLEDYDGLPDSKKTILVDRSDQKLYAYDGEDLFMEVSISTGLALTPTPRGVFTIFRKTPSRYMQGPLPYLNDKSYYDLPGVPWNMYFTEGGAVIHGAYWHESFGSPYSHGCVNLPVDKAYELYEWADLGMTVTVRD